MTLLAEETGFNIRPVQVIISANKSCHSQPPPSDPFLEWLNRVCVIVGLFFFGLAIFTFLLCSWNPKINNTARLHMCLNLAFTHLLLLWNDQYLDSEVTLTQR